MMHAPAAVRVIAERGFGDRRAVLVLAGGLPWLTRLEAIGE
jgi:hypothetical protein